MLSVRTEDNKIFKQISTPCFEDRVIADGGTVSTLDYTDKILNEVAAIGVQPSLVMVPSGIKDSKLYSQIPYGGGADFTVTRSGTTGMRINGSGYWQPVTANTPRVDLTWNAATQMFEEWLNIEQASTNLIARARSFAHSDWTKSGARIEGDPSTAGAELVVNGDFSSSTGWTLGAGWVITDGKAVATASTTNLSRSAVLAVGKTYRIEFTISDYVGGTLDANVGGSIDTDDISANGTYVYYLSTSVNNNIVYLRGRTAFTGKVDNFSVKEVTGYACPFVTSAGVNTYEGYKLVEGTNNGMHSINKTSYVSTSLTSSYTFSFFALPSGRTRIRHYEEDWYGAAEGCTFILEGNGSTTANGAYVTSSSCTLQSNGYYKCSITFTTFGSQISIKNSIRLENSASTSYLGDGTSGIYICHAQLEAGAVATSPIYGAETSTQTRNADAIVKTGASALVGQTEGYVIVDVNISKLGTLVDRVLFYIDDETTTNRIRVVIVTPNVLYLRITTNGVSLSEPSYSIPSIGNYRIGVAWKSNESALYINGVSINNSLVGNFTPSAPLNRLVLGSLSGTLLFNDRVKIVDMGKTRISNAQLAALTTL